VNKFCYVCDMLSVGADADAAVEARNRIGWNKLRKLVLVGRLVQTVYCGKTADWIWMPFGEVSGAGRGMGVLDEGEGRSILWVNMEHLIVTNGEFVAYLCKST